MRMRPSNGSFDQFVEASNLEVKNVPLSKLARLPDGTHVALAFDGNKILDDLVMRVHQEAPMATFTTTTPLAVYQVLEQYSLLFNCIGSILSSSNSSFTCAFVFNGCGARPEVESTPRVSAPPDDLLGYRATSRNSSVLQLPACVHTAHASRFMIDEELEGMIVRQFHNVFGNTFRSPYLAWSQIAAYFARPNPYISEVYGSLNLLAFPGIERVVTGIDRSAGTFSYVSKASVLAALNKAYGNFTEDDFCNLLLFSRQSPVLSLHIADMPTFDELCRLPGKPRTDVVLRSTQLPPGAKNQYMRNIAALDAPVMSGDGRVIPLSALLGRTKRTPDLGAVFGRPLPVILYYLLMSGPLMASSFSVVGQSSLVDDWPLIDTPFFRFASQKVLPLRVHIAFQLHRCVDNGMPESKVELKWLRHYFVSKGNPHRDPRCTTLINPPFIKLTSWVVDENLLEDLVYENYPGAGKDEQRVYFSNVLHFCNGAVETAAPYPGILTTTAGVLLRSIDLLGYFTHTFESTSSDRSSYCIALQCFSCPSLSEYGLLFIELMRCGVITDEPINVVIDETPPVYEAGVRLASRVMSLVHINVVGSWDGPFDPEMAAFGVVARKFSRILRQLTEVSAVHVFAQQETAVALENFELVVNKLPFSLPLEFNAGLLVTYILTNPQCTMDELKEVFGCLRDNLENDITTLFSFWSMACRAYAALQNEKTMEDDHSMDFAAADVLVNQAFERLLPDAWRVVIDSY